MTIAAKDVKKLRDLTGAGIMDSKRALQEAGGNVEKAIDLLRKKGQKVAAKRAGRQANQGLVVTRVSDDHLTGIILEANCETDFVARNDEFAELVGEVGDLILSKLPADLDALWNLDFQGSRTVAQALTDLTGKIGEKLVLRRFATMQASSGHIVAYVHPGSRLGVLVNMEGDGELASTGRDIAMQVAALNPVATHRTDVPQSIREKEMEIAREAARNTGKPEHILDRIARGKLERYFKDHVLVEQPFVKDASMRVRDVLERSDADVRSFIRFALGD